MSLHIKKTGKKPFEPRRFITGVLMVLAGLAWIAHINSYREHQKLKALAAQLQQAPGATPSSASSIVHPAAAP
jgi:hypothetical protein